METLAWVISALGAVAAAFWIASLTSIVRDASHWLADTDALHHEPTAGWPGVTVVFAARDEEQGIEAAARSFLAQDYPGLEVKAVDDRSNDGTGPILDRLAAQDARLSVVHIETLPEGWLGKTHALQMAATEVKTPWLLFTDADILFAPDTLRKALVWVEREGTDHLTVIPRFITASRLERIFLALFGLSFTLRILGGKANRPGLRTHLGFGAFNLVRRTAFEKIGGFEHLKLSIDDDNRLAQALKASGARGCAVMGAGTVSVRWQIGLCGLIRGVEKNLFAVLEFLPGRVAALCLGWLIVGIGPFAGLFFGPFYLRVVCAAGIAAIAGLFQVGQRQTGMGGWYALAFPLTVVLVLFAFLRSTSLTLRHNGVVWRGTLYPLEQLRKHVRDRNIWLRELCEAPG